VELKLQDFRIRVFGVSNVKQHNSTIPEFRKVKRLKNFTNTEGCNRVKVSCKEKSLNSSEAWTKERIAHSKKETRKIKLVSKIL
jgi:hypothetical protein